MNSFLGKKWQDAPEIKTLEEFISKALSTRGLETHEEIDNFCNPKLSHLHDPFGIWSMGCAVSRIKKAIKNKERIVVFGDFDADGITSTVILVDGLKKLDAQVSYRIPSRKDDGHGLKKYLIDEIASKDVSLIITCDCGVNDKEQVEYAARKGIDVIISDHHSSDKTKFPDKAVAVLNPNITQCNYPEKTLAGAGVAFKLITALASELLDVPEEIMEFLTPYLELVAIGTVADCVPLTGENRILVSFGLEKMKDSSWAGIETLKERSNIDSSGINTDTIGFAIAPKLNAASRLGDVLRATELFLGNSSQNYERLTYLDGLNEKRKILTQKHIKDAQLQLDKKSSFQFLIDPDWEVGILGLMASHISDKMSQPVFAGIEKSDNTIAFSARAPAGYSIINALNNCDSNLFLGFGGHDGAAGFQAKKENFDKIKNSLEEYFTKNKQKEISTVIEAIVSPQILNFELINFFKLISPFGKDNLQPILCLKNVKISSFNLIGKDQNHLKITGKVNNEFVEFIGFFWGELAQKIKSDRFYDICFTVSENIWNGERKLQLKLIDMRVN